MSPYRIAFVSLVVFVGTLDVACSSGLPDETGTGGGTSTGGKSTSTSANASGGMHTGGTHAGGTVAGGSGNISNTGGALGVGGAATGGGTSTAGTMGSGGLPSTGGTSSAAGNASTGGAVGTGGTVAMGGTSSTGGAVGTGGSLGIAGTLSTDGTSNTGGHAGTGGAVVTGGTLGTGGLVGTGGVTGGTTAIAGASNTGGVAATGGTLATGGTQSTGGSPGPSWEPMGTGPARAYFGIGYDEGNDRLILYGGDDATTVGSSHENEVVIVRNASGVNGAMSWATLTVTGTLPPPRVVGATVYDSVRNRLIIHGGCGSTCSPALSDTWVLSNANGLGGSATWSRLSDAPKTRAQFGGVYDAANRRLIVFGGDQGSRGSQMNDVWVMAEDTTGATTWSQLTPQGTPPAPRLYYGGLTYDTASNRMMVFGGTDGNTVYNDAWVLTNANGLGGTPVWIQLTPTGTPPPSRFCDATVYDPISNRVAFFGGYDNASELDDVWVLTHANGLGGTPQWIQLQSGLSPWPIARYSPAFAYSVTNDRLIVSSGINTTKQPQWLSDAWVLKGVRAIN